MTLSQSPLITVSSDNADRPYYTLNRYHQNRAYTTSQITDLTEKIDRAEPNTRNRATIGALAPEVATAKLAGGNGKGKEKEVLTEGGISADIAKEETALHRVVKDSKSISAECHHGLM